MREILFRGWSDISDRWVYGYLVRERNSIHDLIHFEDGSGFSSIVPESIGQYTGLKDKNGVKVFEGDIVQDEEHYYSKVYWCNDNYMWCLENFGPLADEPPGLEVIGNIYENKELLND